MRIMNIFTCKIGYTSNLRHEIIVVIHKLIKSIYNYYHRNGGSKF